MNLAKRFQLLNLALGIVFSVSGLVAGGDSISTGATKSTAGAAVAGERPEFTKIDQPFAFFRAIKGEKYPSMIKYVPAKHELDVVLCGAFDEKGAPRLSKTAQDLETLIPLRNTMKNAESCVQKDEKYEGYREAYLAIALEQIMYALELMPEEGYTGTVLVDEYVAGIPMKWVLSSVEQFRALKAYFTKNILVAGIVPAALKPLLLLEFMDKDAQLDSDDQAFLNTYFQVLDVQDQKAKCFFDDANKALYDAIDKTKDAKNIAETLGEKALGVIVDDNKDLDLKKLIFAALVSVTAVKALQKIVLPTLESYIPDWFFETDKYFVMSEDGEMVAMEKAQQGCDKIRKKDKEGNLIYDAKKIALIVGGALAAGLVYNVVKRKLDRNKKAEQKKAAADAAKETRTVLAVVEQ